MADRNKPHTSRKKKFVFQEKCAPFPIPISSITHKPCGRSNWHHYTGTLHGEHVTISHTGDISYLNDMGFFGQGLMSRGFPELYQSLPTTLLPRSGEPERIRVMRKRMYLRHMRWKKSNTAKRHQHEDLGLSSQLDLDQEFDSDLDYFPLETEDCMNPTEEQKLHEYSSCNIQSEHEMDSHGCIEFESEESDFNYEGQREEKHELLWNHEESWENETANQSETSEFWSNSANQKLINQKDAADSWDTAEADEDFWACDDNAKEEETEQRCDKVSNSYKDAAKTNAVLSDLPIRTDLDKESLTNLCRKREFKQMVDDEDYHNSLNVENKKCKSNVTESFETKDSFVELRHKTEDEVKMFGSSNEVKNDTEINNSEKEFSEADSNIPKEKYDIKLPSNCLRTECELNETERKENTVQNIKVDQSLRGTEDGFDLPFHPYCETEDGVEEIEEDPAEEIDDTVTEHNRENGDDFLRDHEYMVIDDSDIDDGLVHVTKKEKYRWKTVRKRDPYRIIEPLVLALEEAFFLSYGLGCLTVKDKDQSSLSLSEMWTRFSALKPRFLPMYAAYHFFRSKGWVPKPGHIFGVDLVLYKVGPPFYHATYSVVVKTVLEGNFEEIEKYRARTFSWNSFAGLYRITEHVAKTLVFCYVVLPHGFRETDASSVACLKQIKIRLQYMNRWISSQEKDRGGEEMP